MTRTATILCTWLTLVVPSVHVSSFTLGHLTAHRPPRHLWARTLEGNDESTELRALTWNVLSSSLCEPSYYTLNKPSDLDPKTRLRRVCQRLEAEVEEQSVISLQEVSHTWAGDLHAWFAQRGYYFVFASYGGKITALRSN